jgi:hypothetical protein
LRSAPAGAQGPRLVVRLRPRPQARWALAEEPFGGPGEGELKSGNEEALDALAARLFELVDESKANKFVEDLAKD